MHDSKPLVFRDVKDEYDAYMKQADYFAGRWNTRREFEWRFLISLWTLLVVGAGFLTGKGQPWSSSWSCVQYLADLVKIGVPVYLHWRWLRGVFGANDYDKKKAHAFQHKAERTLTGRLSARQCFALVSVVLGTFFNWSMNLPLSCALVLSLALLVLYHLHFSPQVNIFPAVVPAHGNPSEL